MKYWENHHFERIDRAKNYASLVSIAFEILNKMPKGIGQVCGPISTGGTGYVDENIKRLDYVIEKLENEGHSIFKQTPFERPMHKIIRTQDMPHAQSNLILLESFYRPIFESGYLERVFFLPDWRSSQGARWEHDKAKELDMGIIYLPEDFCQIDKI